MDSKQMKVVYAITERGEKSYWTKIGVAYTNRDGSITIKLEAMPVGGTMQVREWTQRDEQERPAGNDGARRGNGASTNATASLADDLPPF